MLFRLIEPKPAFILVPIRPATNKGGHHEKNRQVNAVTVSLLDETWSPKWSGAQKVVPPKRKDKKALPDTLVTELARLSNVVKPCVANAKKESIETSVANLTAVESAKVNPVQAVHVKAEKVRTHQANKNRTKVPLMKKRHLQTLKVNGHSAEIHSVHSVNTVHKYTLKDMPGKRLGVPKAINNNSRLSRTNINENVKSSQINTMQQQTSKANSKPFNKPEMTSEHVNGYNEMEGTFQVNNKLFNKPAMKSEREIKLYKVDLNIMHQETSTANSTRFYKPEMISAQMNGYDEIGETFKANSNQFNKPAVTREHVNGYDEIGETFKANNSQFNKPEITSEHVNGYDEIGETFKANNNQFNKPEMKIVETIEEQEQLDKMSQRQKRAYQTRLEELIALHNKEVEAARTPVGDTESVRDKPQAATECKYNQRQYQHRVRDKLQSIVEHKYDHRQYQNRARDKAQSIVEYKCDNKQYHHRYMGRHQSKLSVNSRARLAPWY